MSDIQRVAARVAGMAEAVNMVMIEPSPVLRDVQAAKHPEAEFLPTIEALPDDLPLIFIANEVLDCLPVRQYVRVEGAWHERLVGLSGDALCFGLARETSTVPEPVDFADGAVFEYSPEQVRFTRSLAAKLKAASGGALLIDYGRSRPEPGDTLQALHRHQKQDPLDSPGQHDLTVWADFPVIAATAHASGLTVSQITRQLDFLSAMGIDARLNALKSANPLQTDKLERQYERLMSPEQMGELFKVLALGYPSTFPLVGLEPLLPNS